MIRFGLGALVVFAVLVLSEGPLHLVSRDLTQPRYRHDAHHVCNLLAQSSAVLAVWWAGLLFFLARSPHARRDVGLVFGWPVVALLLMASGCGVHLFRSFHAHDEAAFAAVLGFLNGVQALVVAHACWALLRPLQEEKRYAWNGLAVSAAFAVLLEASFLVGDRHWHVTTSVTVSCAALLVVGVTLRRFESHAKII